MILDPSEQFLLNIVGALPGMFLVNFSRSFYQRVDPILGVGVLNTGHGLMTLNILGNTKTCQFNLILNSRENFFGGTGITRLSFN